MNKLFVIVIIMMITSISFYYYQFENNEITREQTKNYLSGNIINNFFIKKEIIERNFFGPETDITAIAGIDFLNDNNEEFFNNLEKLEEVKISFKYYIPKEEYDTKTGRYVYSLTSYCYIKETDERVIEFHRKLIKTPAKEIIELGQEFDVNLLNCMKNGPYKLLKQDMLDTETYKFSAPSLVLGIDGQYLFSTSGIGSIDRINQKITDTRIRIGI